MLLIYILATPIGLMACYSSIKLGLSVLDNSTEFHMANFWIALSNTLVFGFKMPYSTDKPIAFIAFILNFFGWLIALIILILAYLKHKPSPTQDDEHNKGTKSL